METFDAVRAMYIRHDDSGHYVLKRDYYNLKAVLDEEVINYSSVIKFVDFCTKERDFDKSLTETAFMYFVKKEGG